MPSRKEFKELWAQEIGLELTSGQENSCDKMIQFLYKRGGRNLFVLKGYAGTGKTTLVSALVRTFAYYKKTTLLLAPTGRAAKVFSSYSSRKAFTIHKIIYQTRVKNGFSEIIRKRNRFNNTLFIVDEVSMIADMPTSQEIFGDRSLLSDLLDFVFEGQNNKIIFVGDDAQLPPVHLDNSPALDPHYLESSFDLSLDTFQLKEVVRQSNDSGILLNATNLRKKILLEDINLPYFISDYYSDFQQLSSIDLEDMLNDMYSTYEPEEVVIITRSNKRATLFNQEVRHRIFFREEKIAAGDLIMAVKNNYYWIEDSSEIGFIANGDMMEVQAIESIREEYGFTFANIRVRFCDYPNEAEISLKVILESIDTEGASLTQQQTDELYHQIAENYADLPTKKERYQAIKNDPHYNALQIKFAYSLTCHKTQGGEWKAVLIDLNYFTEEHQNIDFLRWLYTAITRSRKELYLLNFPNDFFEGR